MAFSPPLVERFLKPFRQFAGTESAAGIVLLTAAAAALTWANSPWSANYLHVWDTEIALAFADWEVRATLHQVINDGLMAVFFFVVGLEIKREVVAGELQSFRAAALPMIAAFGGMVVPALIYAVVNHNGRGATGWGVPMATDIAFALGVLTLLGNRVPTSLKVFVAAFAIADDIGAILVIAIFYSGGVDWPAVAGSIAILIVSVAANFAGVRRSGTFAVLGILLWTAVLWSGIHATVAGVLLALTIPVRTRIGEETFLARAQDGLTEFRRAAALTRKYPDTTVLSNSRHHAALEQLERLVDDARPPLIRLEHALHGVVSFGIMPLFVLANAGVVLNTSALSAVATHPVAWGALAGLVIGKPVGITLFSWIAVRIGVAALPNGVDWRMLTGAGVLGGVGFTMALFIARLAFHEHDLIDAATIGVLTASAMAGGMGWLLLRIGRPVLVHDGVDDHDERKGAEAI